MCEYDFLVEFSDGTSLDFECTEDEIIDTVNRIAYKRGYVIYKIKRIKEIFKESEQNEKV